MIIGVGGISRAGKGTLCRQLAEYFTGKGYTVAVIHQDQYIAREELIPLVKDRLDWEHPDSLDFPAFYQAILIASKESDMVIAEGLMCFYNDRVNSLFKRRIFIEITWTTFLQRRRLDFRWFSEPEPTWYLKHVWESYNRYGMPALDDSYLRLFGEVPFDMERVADWIISNP